ncbi:MAG: hypothetical protein OXE77_05550, partial [Flavobacteriaceae bacterium]|nr:hypothetical protein [Flavobacteriaceae bacterium]
KKSVRWSRGFQTMFKALVMMPCVIHSPMPKSIEGMEIQEIKAIGRGYQKFENLRAVVLFFNDGFKL